MLFWPGHTSEKWYYQLMENFDVYLHAKKSPSLLAFFLRYRKDIANLSEYFGHTWRKPSKKKYQLVENFDIYQYAKNQPHQSRLSWDNVNNSLGMPGHTHQIRQYQHVENFDVYLHKKATLFLTSFLRYCKDFEKLVILDTLGMTDQGHQRWYYQLLGKFDVYQGPKNQLHSSAFSWNIAKILWTCHFCEFWHV